jgi:hypothetical protein
MKELASSVRYIKVASLGGIDTSSLVSDWNLSPDQRELFPEFKYKSFECIVPNFVGEGHLWSAAFGYDGLLHTWASVDCTTPLDVVIKMARQYYENKALYRDVTHELLFVMKTSWKGSSMRNCGYEIFEP